LRPFVTGSRAYGTPREDSDIDLVVLTSEGTIRELKALADNGADVDLKIDYGRHNVPLRFGPLNLICVTDPRDYEVWREGTQRLILRSVDRPVTRDEAVACFRELRTKAREESDAVSLTV
jgi:predicted nucleotidyltransferase